MKYKMLKEDVDELSAKVKEQPFFIENKETPMFHGTQASFDDITKFNFKYRKAPKDTHNDLHNAINELSEDELEIPVRNLLFAYLDAHGAENYGNVYVIIPIGSNYQIFFHPDIDDMTGYYHANMDTLMDNIVDTAIDHIHSSDIIGDNLNHQETHDAVVSVIDHMSFHTSNTVTEFRDILEKSKDGIIDTLKELDRDEDDIEDMVDEISDGDWIDEIISYYEEDIDLQFEDMATEYITGIEVFEDGGDVSDVGDAEMMVYAPDGFYAIPQYVYFSMLDEDEEEDE